MNKAAFLLLCFLYIFWKFQQGAIENLKKYIFESKVVSEKGKHEFQWNIFFSSGVSH